MERKKRLVRVAIMVTLSILIGLLYAFIVSVSHHGIPCYFRLITGQRCPGCGMTHSMICLLHLDVTGAMEANILIIPILLFVMWVFIWTSAHYVKTGNLRLGTGCEAIEIIFLIILIIWAIVRNIIGI